MSDTEDSVVADSVDSTASLSPTILRGLESIKSRSLVSDQVLIPAQHLDHSTNFKTSDPVQNVQDSDSQETQIPETRCEAMSSNEQSGSTVFPNTQNMEKMIVDKTKDDTKKYQAIGSMSTKKASSSPAETTKKHPDDIQIAPACLYSDCICKKAIVSLGELADVQQEVQQLLRNAPMSEETNHQTKHLLRAMQQHLRQLTKKQHVHLQNLREMTKQPTTSQPPDLKFQLKQIMAEKQQMLQLLKRHHTLASTLNVATKESSAESDSKHTTDGSHSDTGSVKSVASHMSTSMLTGTSRSVQHGSASNMSYTNVNLDSSMDHDNPPTKIKTIPGLTICPSKPPTASTSAPVGIRSKWVPPYSFIDNEAKQPQNATVSGKMKHQSTAKAQDVSTTKAALTKPMKDQIPLTKRNPLSAEDINKIVEAHLSQQRQTSGKASQPTKIIINIPKAPTATSIGLPLQPQIPAGQNALRHASNLLAGEKSAENQTSAGRLSFPTLGNSSAANIYFSNSQPPTPVPISRSIVGKSTSGPQYYTTNVAIPSPSDWSQPHTSLNPAIKVQTAVKITAPLTPASTKPSARGPAPLMPTNTISPASNQLLQSSNQFLSRFGVPQSQNEHNKSSSNLNAFQPAQNIQNSYLAPTRSHNTEVESENKCFESQQATQDRPQGVPKKPATLVQLLDGKLLQPGVDVLSFTASIEDQTYRASLDAKGFIIDKDRGCFTGPSQWVASVTTRSVASASKIAWKFVHFRGESLVSLQQQWAARQVSSSSTIAQKMTTVSLESQTVLEQSQTSKHDFGSTSTSQHHLGSTTSDRDLGSKTSKHDLGLMMLASDVRVHLIMTEELYPVTKADWENIPCHVYADIDKWE